MQIFLRFACFLFQEYNIRRSDEPGRCKEQMALHKMCVLYDRECIGCGECDRCDLDPEKICDNCMKCVNGDAEYRGVEIEGIELKAEYPFPNN